MRRRDAEEAEALTKLITQAEDLAARPQDDPKLRKLIQHLRDLHGKGARPVVFCRFISTAEAVGEALRQQFKRYTVEIVTGRLTPEERRVRVEALADHHDRILIATDSRPSPLRNSLACNILPAVRAPMVPYGRPEPLIILGGVAGVASGENPICLSMCEIDSRVGGRIDTARSLILQNALQLPAKGVSENLLQCGDIDRRPALTIRHAQFLDFRRQVSSP